MEYSRDIVILANSIKKGGRCIAGKDTETKEWIRPVQIEKPFKIPDLRKYCIQKIPQKLDVYRIPFLSREHSYYHPEDGLIDETLNWELIRTITISDIVNLLDSDEENDVLDIVGSDRINADILKTLELKNSLQLVELNYEINQCELHYNLKTTETNSYYQPYLHFQYKDQSFQLSVTDPSYSIRSKESPVKIINHCYMVVGLGEIYYNHHYLFIVGLFENN